MKKLIVTICSFIVVSINISAQQTDFPKLTGPYLGQEPPGNIPEIFAKGIELGSFLKRNPMQLALVLWAMFSGLILWEESKRSLDTRKDFLKPTLEIAFEIFGRGVKSGEPV